jgi:hypothetical protein
MMGMLSVINSDENARIPPAGSRRPSDFLCHRVRDGYDAIIEACCNAWNKLMEMTERITFLTRRA